MRNVLSCLLLSSLFACASNAVGEFPEEDPDVVDGKADGTGLFTYYKISVDAGDGTQLVSRVNLAKTRCADGKKRAECELAAIDLEGSARPTKLEELLSFDEGRMLYHGRLVSKPDGLHLVADAKFQPLHFGLARGTFVQVYSLPECVDTGSDACPYVERKLNSSRETRRDAYAMDKVFNSTEEGVLWGRIDSKQGAIVAGQVDGDGVRHISGAWIEVVERTDDACQLGCDGMLCLDPGSENLSCDGVIYGCESNYGYCAVGADGHCGWQANDDSESCNLADPDPAQG